MKKIGLVLTGGGGRGAYQIGVWKALKKAGLEEYIASVSGASVGGLNAALFMQKDLDKAQNIWESISMKKILTPKSESAHRGRWGFFERDGLEKIIDENLDMRCFDDSGYNCWMACVRRDMPNKGIEEVPYTTPIGLKATRKYVYGNIEYFNLKYVKDDETKKKILLATSAMPLIFPQEEIEGHKYLDGGARLLHGDNVPVRPLYEIVKCKVILIVHLTTMDKPVSREEFPNAILYERFPRDNSGGLLDYSAEGAKKRMDQGFEENLELFRRIKENINVDRELRSILEETCEREKLYFRIEEAQRQEFDRLIHGDEKGYKGDRTAMEIIETVDYNGGDLNLDFAGVIAKMLEDYSDDDLTELLCECEMLLQTNGIYLKKLKERGFRKLYNLVTGIEGKCKYRLQDNYQRLHKITLLVEKKFLLRFNDLTCLVSKLREKQAGDNIYMRYCINSLAQMLNDSQTTIKKVDIEVALLKWMNLKLEQEPYISGSDTRKVLQIVSDIYVITGGRCECEHKDEIIEKALKQLELLNAEISPIDFAEEIMRNSEYLPLYIKERGS